MALVDKFYSMDNGRIANGFLVASYSSFGVPGQQWYAGISAIVMLALLWAWTAALRRTSGWHVPRGVPLFSAAMILALFCFASTNTYKTFFWPASSVSHTFPPVLAAATTIPALLATSRRGRAFAVASACVVGTVMGTLSEETSVVALTLLVLTMLLARRLFPSGRLAFVQAWCVSAAGGIVLGTAVLFTSPGSRNRRAHNHAGAMFTPESLAASLRGYVHILLTFATNWQYLGAIAVGTLIGLLARREDGGIPGRIAGHPSSWASVYWPCCSPDTCARSSPIRCSDPRSRRPTACGTTTCSSSSSCSSVQAVFSGTCWYAGTAAAQDPWQLPRRSCVWRSRSCWPIHYAIWARTCRHGARRGTARTGR